MLKTIAGRDGRDGVDGTDGKSVYDLACDFGFLGTKRDFFALVLGKTWAMDHESVYQAAISHGFNGSLEQLLDLLRGPPGADGKSAYDIAVEHGFNGTKADWLQSLKGKDGRDGKDGEKGERGIRGEKGEKGDKGERGPAGSGGVVSGGGGSIYAKGIKLKDAGGFYPGAENVEAALQQIAGGGGGGGSTTANNGLTKTGDNIQLGGPLVKDTEIHTASKKFSVNTDDNLGLLLFGDCTFADPLPVLLATFTGIYHAANASCNGLYAVAHNNANLDGAGSSLNLWATNGTSAAPTTVGIGKEIGTILFGAYDGTTIQNPAYISCKVVGAVSAGMVPADLIFWTGGSVGGFVEAGRIKDNGDLQWVGNITGANLSGTNTGDQTLTDVLTASITNGDTTHAPNGDVLFDALALKADLVGGVIPTAQIPAIAITEYLGTVASQAAMLALVGQKGDWALRSDLGTTFIITGNDPTQLSDWTQLNYPTAPVTSVNGQTGTVVLAKGDVGLGNVDNTSDANKPVSTAQATADSAVASAAQTYADGKVIDSIADSDTTHAPSRNAVFDALALKQNALGFTAENVANKDTDVALAANSDTKYASQKAVKAYIDGLISGLSSVYQAILSLGANTFYARSSSGAAANKTITDFGLSLVDDADAATARTTLGLDTNPTLIFASVVSAVSLGNDNSAHSIFAAANDTLTVAANTTYIVEGVIRVTNGNTTHTDAFGFGGTATFTSIGYDIHSVRANAGAISTGTSSVWVTTATSTVFDATSTSQGCTARIRGMIRTNGAGTIIPQWTFSADPTGTCQVEPNSYLTFRRVGADTIASNGAWA